MISLNTITKDTLTSESEKHPVRGGSFKNDYLLTDIVVGESVNLSLVSDQFDTYLELIDQETGEIIAENDDIGSLLNSELNFTPEAGINYLVRVTSYDSQETGDYTLIVGKPDLDIDLDITSFIAPSTGVLGETIEVSWIVKNQGTDATIVNWYDSVYISDDEIVDDSDLLFAYVENGGEDFTSLAGGESISSSFNLRLLNDAEPGDNRYLLLVADTESVLPETDKTNNTLAVEIALTAPDVDLTISNVSVPTELIANETVEASWTVTNEGTDTTNSEWYDYVYLSDDEFLDDSDTYISDWWTHDRELTPLDNRESYTVTNSFDLPDAEAGDEPDGMASQRYLLFVANRWNYQSETNQENNTVAIPIAISPPDVDLTITTDLEALTGKSGDRISLNWTVANQGTQSTNVNSWSDLVYLSQDQTIDDSDIYLGGFAANSNIGGVPLAAGENYDRSYFPILPDAESGQYYLLFNANGDSSQAETKEDNNVVAVPLTLTSSGEINHDINHVPEVKNAIADRDITLGDSFEFTIPQNTFEDPDPEDNLTFNATLLDNSDLPDWLNFATDTQTFTGTPSNDDLGNLEINIQATDSSGATISDSFTLAVTPQPTDSRDLTDLTVYRFYNSSTGVHFYTADEAERDYAIQYCSVKLKI